MSIKEKIWIDCDPGHDDAAAIMYALAHNEFFDVVGFSTVCGNALVEKCSDNLNQVLSVLDYPATIYQGARKPLLLDPDPQPMAHGISGMDGPDYTKRICNIKEDSAIKGLVTALESSDEPITIVALAPLTNIALLLESYAYLFPKIKQIVLMGGSLGKGNINACAEFNIYADSHSAKIIFAHSHQVSIVVAPLEVCNSVATPLSLFDTLHPGTTLMDFLIPLFKFYCKYAIDHHMDKTPIFDVVPIMMLQHPELFSHDMMDIDIVTEGKHTQGMMVTTNQGHGSVKVLLNGDAKQFNNYLFESFQILDRRLQNR